MRLEIYARAYASSGGDVQKYETARSPVCFISSGAHLVVLYVHKHNQEQKLTLNKASERFLGKCGHWDYEHVQDLMVGNSSHISD